MNRQMLLRAWKFIPIPWRIAVIVVYIICGIIIWATRASNLDPSIVQPVLWNMVGLLVFMSGILIVGLPLMAKGLAFQDQKKLHEMQAVPTSPVTTPDPTSESSESPKADQNTIPSLNPDSPVCDNCGSEKAE